MRIGISAALLVSLLLSTGCSICCTPYDECGPTAMSGLCNTRAGSVLSYSGPQGDLQPGQSGYAAGTAGQRAGSGGYAMASGSMNYSPSPTGYVAAMPTGQASQETVYAWNRAPASSVAVTALPGQPMQRPWGEAPGQSMMPGYVPAGQTQMAAIPEELQDRYPAGRSANF